MLKFSLRFSVACAVSCLVAMIGPSKVQASDYDYSVNFSIPSYGNTGAITFTGDIIATCNQCFLNQFDVVAYQFNFSNPAANGSVSSSTNNFGVPLFFVNPTPGPFNFSTLVALPTAIIFDPEVGYNNLPFNQAGTDYFENIKNPSNSNSLILSFASLARAGACSTNCGQISLYGPGSQFENALGFSAVFWSDDFETIADNPCIANFGNCIEGLKPPHSVQFIGGGNFVVDGTPLFVTSPTPLPAALPLFGTGLGVMGLMGWRRRRKSAAVIADGVAL